MANVSWHTKETSLTLCRIYDTETLTQQPIYAEIRDDMGDHQQGPLLNLHS